jgi:mannose-6-phosphate isomerase-like protein (cupin superfamily)
VTQKNCYRDIETYITKDGSEIRELMHPGTHASCHQSLAEARVPPGGRTRLHRHHRSEEIYHVTAGRGIMILGESRFPIEAGDTVCIPPGAPHNVANSGTGTLVILCFCVPPYTHDDTELLDA